MTNVIEHILNLSENQEYKLKKTDIRSKIEQAIMTADNVMNGMMRFSIESLQQKIESLRTQRKCIPALSIEAATGSACETGKPETGTGILKNAVNVSAEIYGKRTCTEHILAEAAGKSMNVSAGEPESILKLSSALQKLCISGENAKITGLRESVLPYNANSITEQATQTGAMHSKVAHSETHFKHGYSFLHTGEKITANPVSGLLELTKNAEGGETAQYVTCISFPFDRFRENCTLAMQYVKDAFRDGFEAIKTEWYKLKSSLNADDAIEPARIQAESDKRFHKIFEANNKINGISEPVQSVAGEIKNVEKPMNSVINNLQDRIVINANTQLQSAGNPDAGKNMKNSGIASSETAAAGTRNATVNINIGNMVQDMVFQGDFSENREDLKHEIEQVMLQVLKMAETAM